VRGQLREIMDELNRLGGMTPAHMALITELVAVCLTAPGPKAHVTECNECNVTPLPLTGAERVKRCRQRKKEATECNVTALHDAVDNNININTSIQEGVGKGGPRKRGTRLPDDWNPSAELWAWGKEKLREQDLRFETAAFKDFWAAKPGAAGTKLDWDKTWKVWVREAVRRRERFKPKDRVTEFVSSGPKRSWAEIKAEKGAK
jgi:hypothetical protein